MADDLRTRIAKVAEAHAAMGYDSDYGPNDSWVCNCGVTWAAGGTHGEHVADAVTRELGLRQERVQLLTRYVTEWSDDD